MALVLLDAGLVGLATLHRDDPGVEGRAFRAWYGATAGSFHRFALADVTRYEARRGLLHKQSSAKLRRLDFLTLATLPVPTSTPAWDLAAEFWARLRRAGRPTAGDGSLDGDAVLAATATVLAAEPTQTRRVVVATTNVRHLGWFGIDARDWRDIADAD